MITLLLADIYTTLLGASIAAFFLKLAIILILLFAIIGVIATITFFIRRKKKEKDPYKEWIKTGKM